MATVSLRDYQRAEREVSITQARIGIWAHAAVTVLVCAVVIVVNVFAAPEFPWSAFPVAGIVLGLFLHWWFGYRHIEEMIQRDQVLPAVFPAGGPLACLVAGRSPLARKTALAFAGA